MTAAAAKPTITRWDHCTESDGEDYNSIMDTADDGDYVLYADHVARISELEAALREFLDLCPRISDDDPIAPALVEACYRGRAALAAREA